jgi:hypothetical protein
MKNSFNTDTTAIYYVTRAGTAQIALHNGRYQAIFAGENLGSYHSAAAAADDMAGGHTFTPSSGIDLADLDIPQDPMDWEQGYP